MNLPQNIKWVLFGILFIVSLYFLDWSFTALVMLISSYLILYTEQKRETEKYDPTDSSVEIKEVGEMNDRFALPSWLSKEYPFNRKVAKIKGLYMHFVDEGPSDAPYTVVLVHGNPMWSYLWRKVIAQLVMKKQIRVIAPDLIGFGLSSKPQDSKLLGTLEFHVSMVLNLVVSLNPEKCVMVGQDWGGPIAAAVAARLPSTQLAGVAFGNTAIWAPKRINPTLFHRSSHWTLISDIAFRLFSFPVPIVHRIQGDPSSLYDKKAYYYPFNNWHERWGPLALARMVPNSMTHPSMSILEEITKWTTTYKGPAVLVWGNKDPFFARALNKMKDTFPQATVIESDAGHFLQEEVPEKFSSGIAKILFK